ncbi:MAG: 30S ribosomal protein S8 [Deltaproteobacteria bacterium]|nr:MAG: 30S ribosomal protein S8 [Deltaproteobacteria bacterium]
MSMSDPVADFLTRIRNAIQARKASVECPRSNLKKRIAEILAEEGFVDGVSEKNDNVQGTISLALRWNADGNAIRGLRRVSRPGQRKYVGAKALPKVRNGLGIAIVSTSKGVMTDRQARKEGVGGEVLCEVW